MGPKRQRDGTWVYTPIGTALETVGLEEIRVYIDLRQKQNSTVHCESSYYGLVSSSGAEYGTAPIQEMVRAYHYIYPGDKGEA